MWSLCDKEGKECIVMIFQKYYTPLSAHGLFKIPYLDAHSNYCELSTLQIYGGDELQNIGISVPLAKEDFHIFEFHFVKI